VAETVARYLARNGVRTGGVKILQGTSSARVQVLPSA
jgi:hypothetical protein